MLKTIPNQAVQFPVDTDVNGLDYPELVVNGGFDTNSDWTLTSGWTISGGMANKAAGNTNAMFQSNIFEALSFGKKYLVSFDAIVTAGQVFLKCQAQFVKIIASTRTYTFIYNGIDDDVNIAAIATSMIFGGNAEFEGSIDNVTVKEIKSHFVGQLCDCPEQDYCQLVETTDYSTFQLEMSENGDDVVSNGTFGSDTVWTKGTGWTISGGEAHHAAGSSSILQQDLGIKQGVWYKIEVTVTAITGALSVSMGGNAWPDITAIGTYTIYLRSTDPFTTSLLQFFQLSTDTCSIDNVTATPLSTPIFALKNEVTGVYDYIQDDPFDTAFTFSFLEDIPRVNITIDWSDYAVGCYTICLFDLSDDDVYDSYIGELDNPSASELITNNSFASGSDWTLNGTGVSIAGGKLVFVNASASAYAQQLLAAIIPFNSGKYKVIFNVDGVVGSNNLIFDIRNQANDTLIEFETFANVTNGTHTGILDSAAFTGSVDGYYTRVRSGTPSGDFNVADVSLKALLTFSQAITLGVIEPILCTECFQLANEHCGTLLLNYNNTFAKQENDTVNFAIVDTEKYVDSFGIIYEFGTAGTTWAQSLRIKAELRSPSYRFDEEYVKTDSKKFLIFAGFKELFDLQLMEHPEWKHHAIRLALSHFNFNIDGVKYVKDANNEYIISPGTVNNDNAATTRVYQEKDETYNRR